MKGLRLTKQKKQLWSEFSISAFAIVIYRPELLTWLKTSPHQPIVPLSAFWASAVQRLGKNVWVVHDEGGKMWRSQFGLQGKPIHLFPSPVVPASFTCMLRNKTLWPRSTLCNKQEIPVLHPWRGLNAFRTSNVQKEKNVCFSFVSFSVAYPDPGHESDSLRRSFLSMATSNNSVVVGTWSEHTLWSPFLKRGTHHRCLPLQRHCPRCPRNVPEACQPWQT